MTSQLKEGDKVYLLTKNLKTRKKSKKLDYVKVEQFLSRSKIELLATNLSYLKILNYNLYFIYYYWNQQTLKYIYRKDFIINFRKKTNLKLKKFQIERSKLYYQVEEIYYLGKNIRSLENLKSCTDL